MRGRKNRPAAPPAAPLAFPEDLFAVFGGLRFALCPGAWAYLLAEDAPRGGRPTRWFDAGETENLWERLGAKVRRHGCAGVPLAPGGPRGDGGGTGRIAEVRVFPCRDRHQARLTQFTFIDRLDLENLKGTAGYEEWRASGARRGASRGGWRREVARMDLPAHVTDVLDERERGRAS